MFEKELTADEARRTNRVRLAQHFGWTLEYIDSLNDFDYTDVLAVMDADEKLNKRKRVLK